MSLPLSSYRFFWTFFIVFGILTLCTEAIDDGPYPPAGNVLGRTLHKPAKCDRKFGINARIKLHYTARKWNTETHFYNSYDTGTPLSYKIGSDKLLKGMEQGLQGMCEHELRRLLIPADLAYGELGIPDVLEPNTPIIMDVELLEVQSPFSNPWFWAGAFVLGAAFFILRQQARLEQQAKAATFLEKKDQ
ncbi:uncharacterized protein BX664DRAFT_320608 [Halteromyces radiatus]|uniref:uncharacterized protein n=1 Tax=Halteromyces radiatus TaxID=101107 RepID=UPI00221E9D8E|nr:uncharacterized protein BX664DRAFT_320608 [Halteromyces radiatus]KAI8099188.1 hypothetical protein BX664DRAFT_320608 [Halteromyces radiatus]